MPGARNRMSWSEMSRREIISTLVAFFAIGSVIAGTCVVDVLDQERWSDAIVSLLGMVVIACVWIVQVLEAVPELRRRGRTYDGK